MTPSPPHIAPSYTTDTMPPTFIPTCALPSPARNLAATTALSALLFTTPIAPARAAAPPPPARTAQAAEHALADETWALIERNYADPNFSGLDWRAEREHLAAADLPSRQATYGALRRSLTRLRDRYTRILQPAQMAALRKFDVSGVGVLLTSGADGALTVAADPAPDTPAAAAGVRRGDVLVSVDGVSVAGRGGFEVAELMQGADGSAMELRFLGRAEPVTLTRRMRAGRSPVSGVSVRDTRGGRLGYVRLREFSAAGREAVADALREVLARGADWIVLDLRGNGGGVFEGALEIAGLFEGDGVPVARVNSRSDGEEVFRSRVVGGGGAVVPAGMPVALVVDGLSASSSEVLAGALRDSCRAVLVGERTFGKGLIQGVFGLSDGGGVVITVGQYRTPGGDVIQGVGLEPGVVKEVSGFQKVLRGFGVERMDDLGVEIDRVREGLRMCDARLGE